jgi:hypothetical protein
VSIAAEFNRKMDVAIDAVDRSRDVCQITRRADLFRALEKAELVLMPKSMVGDLIRTIEELRS